MVNEESERITDLEQQLGLPLGFFGGLVKEHDWSFVVKLHALIESTCSLLLRDVFTVSTERFFLKEQRTIDLAKQFSWLELSNVRTGKIAFLKGMQLIEKSHISFISSLSELRNRLVHDVSKVGFSFNEFINNLDDNQFKKFRNSLGYAIKSEMTYLDRKYPPDEFIRNEPLMAIWHTGFDCLAHISRQLKFIENQIVNYRLEALSSLKSVDMSFDWSDLGNWKDSGGGPEIIDDGGGKVLKLKYTEKRREVSSNCSAHRYLGIVQAGGIVQAKVRFKCALRTFGMIFIGDVGGPDPYDNSKFTKKGGNGDWQDISAEVKYSHEDVCFIYLYGNRDDGKPGDYVLYKDLEVKVFHS